MKKSPSLAISSSLALTLLSLANAPAQNVFPSGDIVVSASTYAGNANTIIVGQTVLPASGSKAVANGSYPNFTNNDSADSNFGITSPLDLLAVNPNSGTIDNDVSVTSLTGMVTSFTSKSEGSLNLSIDGTALTIMDYFVPSLSPSQQVNQLDISNANTPLDQNGATTAAPNTYRCIAQINYNGTGTLTETNLYSGDNPRAAYLTATGYYTVGNSGDKKSAPLKGATFTGAQLINTIGGVFTGNNNSGTDSLGQYNITQNGQSADTLAKDNNFRGLTVYNNTVYVAKGSGGNGIDSVYQVGTAGTLPTGTTNPITILPGFNTLPATNDGDQNAASNFTHPFGLWFANPTTLYVGDEGAPIANVAADIVTLQNNPSSTSVDGQQFAGLDKYSLVNGVWQLDYVLTSGLGIGTQYQVSGTTPGGDTGTYTTATAGLRQITGRVNNDGTVTIYAITSTYSSNMDPGTDPNQVVKIVDHLSYTTAAQAQSEAFSLVMAAAYGQVLRGVSLPPAAPQNIDTPTMPQWGLIGLGALLFSLAAWFLPTRRLAFQS